MSIKTAIEMIEIKKSQSKDRLKRLNISPQLLMFLGSGRFEVFAHQIPEDANLIRSYYDIERDWFTLVIASDTFEPVLWGDEIPNIEPPSIREI